MTAPSISTPVVSSRRSIILLFLGAIGIGLAPLFVRWSEVGVAATGFWRLTLSFPIVALWGISSARSGTQNLRGTNAWLMALAGAFFAADLVLWHSAIRMTSVANATLETNLSAILVPLSAWLFWRQRLRPAFILALVTSIIGVLLLVGKNAQWSPRTLNGDLLGSLSAVFYSGYLLSVKAARDRGLSAGIIMTVSGFITALALLLVALITHETIIPATAHGWTIVGTLAVVSQLGGQCLIAYALIGLPAAFASVGLLVQPAASALAAWLVLGEALSPGQFAGALVLVLGLYLAARSQAAR